ncbi:hypothetical protein C0584_04040 [Candidatus Parcubacteria bacterium]|nr:MAG: hypothetical protein C0584_04040 [Candidatus Parcubacteria bacterium]
MRKKLSIQSIFLNLIILFLFIVIIVLLYRFFELKNTYNNILNTRIIKQEQFSYKYYIHPGYSPYKIVIGDVIGIDKPSYNFVEEQGRDSPESALFIPGINKNYDIITKENFLDLATNENNILISDNFCSDAWQKEAGLEIYQAGNISRGPFCGSEKEVVLIDKLIKQYNPEKIDIYYSNDVYRELLGGFLVYLDDLGFNYELIKVDEK